MAVVRIFKEVDIASEIEIVPGHKHLREVATLFREYKSELKVDVSFQPADEMPSEIALRYRPPRGDILLAMHKENAAGCIAFHPLTDPRDCELKRLFVRSEYRGLKIGQKLMQESIDAIKRIGYRAIYLDTLSTLSAACHLYEQFGFQRIDPYYYNPLPNVVYYRLDLSDKE